MSSKLRLVLRGVLTGLLLTLALAACTSQVRRTVAEVAADGVLAGQVERALLDDPGIYARHVDVTAKRSVIQLSGFVWSTNDLYAVRRIAAAVPGVAGVDDDLELKVGGRTSSR